MGEDGSFENEEAVFGGARERVFQLAPNPVADLLRQMSAAYAVVLKSRHALEDFHGREPSPFAITVASDRAPVCHLATAATLRGGNCNEP
jgi:hypothetical protein